MSTMTAENDIITVIQTPLASLSTVDASNVVYVNVPYTGNEDVHIVCNFLPSQPFQAGLGTYGKQRYDGLFQIDVLVPIGDGRATMNAIMTELKSLYKRGTTLQNSQISVQCKTVWEGASLGSPNWYIVPLNIRYYAYVDNE